MPNEKMFLDITIKFCVALCADTYQLGIYKYTSVVLMIFINLSVCRESR